MKKHAWMILICAACGGPAATEGSGGDGTGGGETSGHRQSARELIGINPPDRPWSEMSHEDREMDMVARFLPIMSEMFQAHDAEEFGDFGCESCHGTDMRERNFEMPGTQLPPVPLAGTPEYQALQTSEPEMMRFMEEEVTPAMQTMLGMGATFTCNGCHPTSGASHP